MMAKDQPTLDEWRKLYAAAGAVKELAPWQWMYEDNIFGVQEPETQETGFVSVMGAGGEHFAVAVYTGAAALYDFLELQTAAQRGAADDIEPERVLGLTQLQASFEDRDLLEKEDREVIRKLGLKFRGANAWPQFRSYAPGLLPWFITAPEARLLTCALKQLLDVAPRFRANEALLATAAADQFLIRTPRRENGKLIWEDQIVHVPSPPPSALRAAPLDPQLIAPLQQLPLKDHVIELEVAMLPTPVAEQKERPYFPYALLVVDANSGAIIGMEMMQPLPSVTEMRAAVPQRVAALLAKLPVLPNQFHVRAEWLAAALQPLAPLGVQIKQTRRLPGAQAALDYMMKMTFG
jgi:hypothetical protein